MNIREFSHNLQNLYQEMSESFSSLQKELNLPCLPGCGKCCLNPEIEATPLEMIPMALKIFDEGRSEEVYELLNQTEQQYCIIFSENKCGSYQERPSVCRMFGVAGYYDKQHQITLSICKIIKEEFSTQTQQVLSHPPGNAPVLSDWTARLTSLDPLLTQDRKPINQALKSALEKVSLWAMYDSAQQNNN
jgi:Fe-S-cluster containining protein